MVTGGQGSRGFKSLRPDGFSNISSAIGGPKLEAKRSLARPLDCRHSWPVAGRRRQVAGGCLTLVYTRGRRPARPGIGGRWLPVWLPVLALMISAVRTMRILWNIRTCGFRACCDGPGGSLDPADDHRVCGDAGADRRGCRTSICTCWWSLAHHRTRATRRSAGRSRLGMTLPLCPRTAEAEFPPPGALVG
jgi:hypothetical protein